MAAVVSLQGLPDIIGEDLNVVFCGINPGLGAAVAGHHFVGRGNRFWRTLHLAGFTPEQLLAQNDRQLLSYGCGLTTAVARPTARAEDLSKAEFIAEADMLEQKIERYGPRYIAFLGKAVYAAMTDQKDLQWGLQADTFGGSAVWVLPNPSGLNRSFSLADLVQAYRQLREAVEQAPTR